MSIKVFASALNVGGLRDLADQSITSGGASLVAFENGNIVVDPANPTSQLSLAPEGVAVTQGDTLSIIKGKLQAAAVADWNGKLGRTDGNTIIFVWLDDKGLL